MKRIVFFGSPDVCIPYLDALYQTEYEPLAIVCNPDRPVGRKQILTPPPTRLWAMDNNIPTYQPETLSKNDEFFELMSSLQPDLFIVIAYGMIMPKRFISLPTFQTINVHYSLLPRWRGACPTESAILHGDTQTAMTIQQMRYELDTGPIIAQTLVDLSGDEYTEQLRAELSQLGAELLTQTLPRIFSGDITPQEQDPAYMTHCHKITKEDAQLLDTDDDITKWRKFRAYHLWPVAWYFDSNNKRVKVTGAKFVDNRFIITKIIREGESETIVGI
jgi:methionyl-tRNA formyltransferase